MHPDHDQIELYLLDRLPSESLTHMAIEEHLLWCEPCIAFAEQEHERILLLRKALQQVVSRKKRNSIIRYLAAGSSL